jgi:hypothetical protein
VSRARQPSGKRLKKKMTKKKKKKKNLGFFLDFFLLNPGAWKMQVGGDMIG